MMHSELLNLWLCARLIGQVLLMTGIGPGIVAAVCAAKFRIVKVGIEQVSKSFIVYEAVELVSLFGVPAPNQREGGEMWKRMSAMGNVSQENITIYKLARKMVRQK